MRQSENRAVDIAYRMLLPMTYLIAAAWLYRVNQTGIVDQSIRGLYGIVMIWGLFATWVAEHQGKYCARVRREHSHARALK